MQDYEKLGAFYLGKSYDLKTRKIKEDLTLYDAKDLTTHGVIIGMTGSGKTGLGVGLIEEALIDRIPVIAIDPKGDIANLALTFPDLQPTDFAPWINPREAVSRGETIEDFAAGKAKLWRKGLADWGQAPERIARLKAAADVTVYTPGSSAGRPVNVLRSFDPPPPEIIGDGDLFRERIQNTVTGLLTLLGIDADPIASREHIFLSNIFEKVWREGRALDLAGLIQAIQAPPFERVGVMDVEFFFPKKDRLSLAMRMNNLLAAPGFDAWMSGDPMDVGRFLYAPDGRPRASIFSISHLSETERHFFVSMLLNQIVGWIRTQPGTASLRAMLYMDEIFGYFPPTKNPPTKAPLLTLLKQARAYGLGVVLATQNPVDLDYKGLANTGTWFIGRLQTERDKQRVLEGLEGAAAGSGFNKSRMEEILAGLGKRVFLLHNVHEPEAVTFHTRWVLSYLAGPMTREQLKKLKKTTERAPDMSAAPPVTIPVPTAGSTPASTKPEPDGMAWTTGASTAPPMAPEGVNAFYLSPSGAGSGLTYQPAVFGRIDMHYSSVRYKVGEDKTISLAAPLNDGPVALDWDRSMEMAVDPVDFETAPASGAKFMSLPKAAKRKTAFGKWRKDMMRWTRQNHPLRLYQARRFKLAGEPRESESEFRVRLAQHVRESRDLAVEKLRRKYASKFNTLQNQQLRAMQTMEREADQARSRKVQTVVSFGSAILGAFLGRKLVSSRSASRMGTAMRSAGRIGKEAMDVVRAKERLAAINEDLAQLEMNFQADLDNIELDFDPSREALDTIEIKPKSADMTLEMYALVWLPYRRSADGVMTPDWI